jgi:uncharacterized membrane protein YfcA
LGAFLPAPTAVALLILPTFLSNVWQTLRDGFGPALASMREYWVILATLLPSIALSAQLLTFMPDAVIFTILGVGITLFSAIQLLRIRLPDPSGSPKLVEAAVGAIGGFFGGVSGAWGPPVMMYLIARNTLKNNQMRAMGVVFLLGAIVLTGAHAASGVLNAETASLSLVGVIPVALGMALGFRLNSRMDQRLFQRATLAVLTIAGLNLLRRGLFG